MAKVGIQVLVGILNLMTWNSKETKSKTKSKPPYWRIVQLLKTLRLPYKERNAGEESFHIIVEQFGIVLRFNKRQQMGSFDGWDVVDVDLQEYELNPIEFGRNLMWLLIAKGYFSFLRGPETGNSKLFRHFLISEGWAQRIFDKRLQLYNNEPRHKYMIEQTKRLQKMPVHYTVMHYPSYFDFLW